MMLGLSAATPPAEPKESIESLFYRHRDLWSQMDGDTLLRTMITDVFPGRIAVSSSFGTESAVLLEKVARIDPATPVIFLDTCKLFHATLTYKDMLKERLGLTDIRIAQPDADVLKETDPDGTLWESNPDACCHIRKVLPMDGALMPFDAWITGRKRIHGGEREALPMVEFADGKIKVNPLADTPLESIQDAFDQRGLPRHPLEFEGYTSVGCEPCTSLPKEGEGLRSGRWAGNGKTECGIHKAPWFGQDI